MITESWLNGLGEFLKREKSKYEAMSFEERADHDRGIREWFEHHRLPEWGLCRRDDLHAKS